MASCPASQSPTAQDGRTVSEATGRRDGAPVVTEPFTEWVLSGECAAGRPRWQDAGATFAPDVAPFEERKLWLLNGGHPLLAYAGSIRGHATVAEAVHDEVCRRWLEQWWDEACAHLTLPADHLAGYRAALLERFANPRMRHLLAQIASDGSQKLPVRILPVLRRERAAGRIPTGATRALAGWICHLRGLSAPLTDARADEVAPAASAPLSVAVRQVLAALDPAVAADDELVTTILAQAQELSA
jgi:fructuronate reductase